MTDRTVSENDKGFLSLKYKKDFPSEVFDMLVEKNVTITLVDYNFCR